MMKQIGFRMAEEDVVLLKKVSDARGEDTSDFIRRSIRTELARLGYCSAEQEKALGLTFGGRNENRC